MISVSLNNLTQPKLNHVTHTRWRLAELPRRLSGSPQQTDRRRSSAAIPLHQKPSPENTMAAAQRETRGPRRGSGWLFIWRTRRARCCIAQCVPEGPASEPHPSQAPEGVYPRRASSRLYRRSGRTFRDAPIHVYRPRARDYHFVLYGARERYVWFAQRRPGVRASHPQVL